MPFDYRRNPTLPTEMLIARSMVQGVEYVTKFGRITNFDATDTPVDIWAGGGQYTGWYTNAHQLEVVSTDTTDNATGTGLQKIQVIGLDTDNMPQNETITLTGTTPTPTTKTYRRVHRMKGIEAGTNGTNTGTITLRRPAPNTTQIASTMLPGIGQTEQATWTIPANTYAVLQSRTLSVARDVGTTPRLVTIAWRIRSAGTTCWRALAPINIAGDASPFVAGQYSGMIKLDAGDDISIRVLIANTNQITATAEFDIYHFPYSGTRSPSVPSA